MISSPSATLVGRASVKMMGSPALARRAKHASSRLGRISLLETFHEVIQYLFSQLPVLTDGGHIVLIANLEDNLIKWLLLLALPDLFIIVINAAVFPCLLGIVLFQSISKQILICLLYWFITIFNI